MMTSRALVAAGLAAGLAISVDGGPALAEDLSARQIQERLTTPKTRSLTATDRPQLSSDDLAFVKRVRGQTRSLSLDDREQMATIATKRPKVDLEINFDYNSAAVTPKAEPQLNSLGKALTAKELAGSVIMLGGHTDAKGSDEYNQRLSERRAETVKRFLIDNYKIPAANLVTADMARKARRIRTTFMRLKTAASRSSTWPSARKHRSNLVNPSSPRNGFAVIARGAALLRGVSKDEPKRAAYPSRLAEDGEHLRMTVARQAEPVAFLQSIAAPAKHLAEC